jgi:hypothetical protein
MALTGSGAIPRQPGYNHWSRALVWDEIAPGESLARALGLKETEFRWRWA